MAKLTDHSLLTGELRPDSGSEGWLTLAGHGFPKFSRVNIRLIGATRNAAGSAVIRMIIAQIAGVEHDYRAVDIEKDAPGAELEAKSAFAMRHIGTFLDIVLAPAIVGSVRKMVRALS